MGLTGVDTTPQGMALCTRFLSVTSSVNKKPMTGCLLIFNPRPLLIQNICNCIWIPIPSHLLPEILHSDLHIHYVWPQDRIVLRNKKGHWSIKVEFQKHGFPCKKIPVFDTWVFLRQKQEWIKTSAEPGFLGPRWRASERNFISSTLGLPNSNFPPPQFIGYSLLS